jgi:hypothetical protein
VSAYSLAWAWQQPLPPVEKLVLLALANRVSDADWHHYSRDGVARFAGVDAARVDEALDRLAGLGAVERRDVATLDLVRLCIVDEECSLLTLRGEAATTKQYVYFLRSRGLIKIGFSTNPKQRIKSIQAGWPHKVYVIKVVQGTRQYEASLHARFAGLHAKGEWFRADAAIESFIESLSGTDA